MIIYSNFNVKPKKTKKEKIITASLYILFGLLFVLLSNFIVKSFALIIGIIIILFGVNRLIFAITYKQSFDLIMGILLITLGIVVTISNEGTITFLKYLIAIGALLLGINRIFYSILLKDVVRYWYVNLLVGITISALSIAMMAGAFGLNVIVIILGCIFLFFGLSKLITTLLTKEEDINNTTNQFFEKFTNKKQEEDIIDVEVEEKNDPEDR